jgi:hypothetical protein
MSVLIGSTDEHSLTFVIRQTVQVHLHGEVVTVFRRNDIGAVLAFEHLLCAIFHQFVEAFDLN